MGDRRRRWIGLAWAGFLLVGLMQFDVWRTRRERLMLGWLPEELAYRLLVLLLAWLLMLLLCWRVWDTERDR